MDDLTIARLKTEKENLELDGPDLLPDHIKWQFKSLYQYVIQIQGKKGTPIEGTWIVADLRFPSDFPRQPPIITFRNNFQHINVWQGSKKLCMFLVNDLHWVAQTTIIDIISGLDTVMHNPTPDDPADGNLSSIYKQNPKKYDDFMREQAKKLCDPKYKEL